MGDFRKSFVFYILEMLQLPCDVEGDMDSLGTNGEGWGDVALQGVADHQQL